MEIEITMMQMESFKTQLRGWSFRKIPRSANEVADYLTKIEVQRSKEFIWVTNELDEGVEGASGLQ